MNWADNLRGKKLIVCLGAGGVGKTTVSAVLGLLGAHLGKKTLVVTIDPAKRLADALGVEVGHAPMIVDCNGPGELHAMMLDMGAAWDDMIARMSSSPRPIITNRFYQYLSREMAGSQEFIACEALHHLDMAHAYELIILDTPPSVHAVDFLDAPARILGFLDQPILPKLGGLTSRILGRFVPGSFLSELSEFLLAFTDMYPSLSKRTKEFQALMAGKDVLYVGIVTPHSDAIQTGAMLKNALEERGLNMGVVILNQVLFQVGLPSAKAGEVSRAVERHNLEARMQKPQVQIARQMVSNAKMLAMLPKLRQDAGPVRVLSELLRALA